MALSSITKLEAPSLGENIPATSEFVVATPALEPDSKLVVISDSRPLR